MSTETIPTLENPFIIEGRHIQPNTNGSSDPNTVDPLEVALANEPAQGRFSVRTLRAVASRLDGLAGNLSERRTTGEFVKDATNATVERGFLIAGAIGRGVVSAKEWASNKTMQAAGVGVSGIWKAGKAVDTIIERGGRSREAVKTLFSEAKAAAEQRKIERKEKWHARKDRVKGLVGGFAVASLYKAGSVVEKVSGAASSTKERGSNVVGKAAEKVFWAATSANQARNIASNKANSARERSRRTKESAKAYLSERKKAAEQTRNQRLAAQARISTERSYARYAAKLQNQGRIESRL